MCGRLIGLLRTVTFEFEKRSQLLKVIGLSNVDIITFQSVVGYFPYLTQGGVINEGKAMDVEKTRKFLPYIADKLGLYLPESDYADITQENVDKQVAYRYTQACKNLALKKAVGETPVQYAE
jgi:predicted glycosyl hydrolase (DUF1957 family)